MTYLIHGTSLEIVKLILAQKNPNLKIKPGFRHFYTWDDSFYGIFLSLFYHDLPKPHRLDCNWFNVAVVLNIDLLDQLPYQATPLGDFDSFNPTILSIGYGRGYGDLEPVKKYVNKYIIQRKSESQSYRYSHEFVVSTDIDIKKYLKVIVIFGGVSVSEQKDLRKLAEQHGFKIVFANNFLKKVFYLDKIIEGTLDPEEKIINPKTNRKILRFSQKGRYIMNH